MPQLDSPAGTKRYATEIVLEEHMEISAIKDVYKKVAYITNHLAHRILGANIEAGAGAADPLVQMTLALATQSHQIVAAIEPQTQKIIAPNQAVPFPMPPRNMPS